MVGPALDRTLRLVLFGDGRWAADALERLARGPHQVVGVVVRERPSDGALQQAAQSLGVPVLRPHDVNDPAFLDQVVAVDLRRKPIVSASVAEDRVDDEALDPDEHDATHDEHDVVQPGDLLGLDRVRVGRQEGAAGSGEEGQREQGSGAKEDPNPRSGLRS